MRTSKPPSPTRVSRRRVLRRWIGGLVGAGGVSGIYGAGFEPFHPRLVRVEIPLPGLPPAFDGFRIAQLSDLHLQPGFPAACLEPALALVNREKPDCIVLTGDYIYDKAGNGEMWLRRCAEAVSGLSAPDGKFAIFGNHDYLMDSQDPPPDPWHRAGYRTLSDQAAEIKRGADSIYLVGLRSCIKRPVDPDAVLRLAPPRAVKIALWHEPDRAGDSAAAGASLQLSGHTHGGQVVLPFIGPPLLPIGGRKYPQGLYRVGTMPLYVSRGVGLLPPRVRLNCPPEVTLVTLRRG